MDKPETIHINLLRLYQRQNERSLNIFLRYLFRHFSACKLSILRLAHTPFTTLLTVGVLGLMLALPLILQLGIHNIQNLGNHWDKGTRITLVLKPQTTAAQIQSLRQKLRHTSGIAKIRYISPAEGAQELQGSFGNLLNGLSGNPVPAVILVDPKALPDAAAVTALLAGLEQLPEVDSAQLDMAWVKRLYYFIDLGERITLALFIIFGLGIILIVNHINKTALKAVQPEITILRWFGATDALIRRPFLYGGGWCGLLGGLGALLLAQLFWWWIEEPVNKLMYSYGNHFVWSGLNLPTVGLILLLSVILGWIGAWIAIRRCFILRKI